MCDEREIDKVLAILTFNLDLNLVESGWNEFWRDWNQRKWSQIHICTDGELLWRWINESLSILSNLSTHLLILLSSLSSHLSQAGALSGLTVDLLFYPIDTIKTRLQSSSGFLASGGFKGVYRGLGSVAVGSAPGAATFFVTYESMKPTLLKHFPEFFGGDGMGKHGLHMVASSIGEVVSTSSASACSSKEGQDRQSEVATKTLGRILNFERWFGSFRSRREVLVMPSSTVGSFSSTSFQRKWFSWRR